MKAEGNRWCRNETIWSTSLGLATKFMFGSSYLNLVSQASCLTTSSTMIGIFDMIVKPVPLLLLMKYDSHAYRLALTQSVGTGHFYQLPDIPVSSVAYEKRPYYNCTWTY